MQPVLQKVKYILKNILLVVAMLLPFFSMAQNSVLSKGAWYKFGITKTGVYKIDAAMLSSVGVNTNALNPKKLRIFGNGGGMLPQGNSEARPNDLQENAVLVSGEADGNFDGGDFILFYAHDSDHYFYDEANQRFVYENNIYADTAYYFLNIGEDDGIRIQSQADMGHGFPTISDFDYYESYEQDSWNALASGRKWYGEKFRDTSKDFVFNIADIKAGSDAMLEITTMSYRSFDSNAAFSSKINGTEIGNQTFPTSYDSQYAIKGRNNTKAFTFNTNLLSSLNEVAVNLAFTPSNNSNSAGYLDYLFLTVKRNLIFSGNQMIFRSVKSLENANSTYEVSNVIADTKIWDITDRFSPKEQQFENSSTAKFGAETTSLKEFIVFNSNYLVPAFFTKIKNQNLHALAVPEMLVVTHADFRGEAERLADFRESNDGMMVKVVDIQEVYNEFSSGAQDITAIRDFVKHLYDQNTDQLKYLLLFGDCSYDYKNVKENNTNRIPIYEARNSLNPVSTFSSDDYFGFLDEDEGVWKESPADSDSLNIGVGRLPVNTEEEAKTVVDKIIHYATSESTLGDWKNTVYLMADDISQTETDFIHLKDAEQLANVIETDNNLFNVNKLYLESYEQEITPGSEEAPLFIEALSREIDKGGLVFNYSGHGGELKLADEGILDIEMIRGLKNYDRLPLFVTATCEFGRYDDPDVRSGAEEMLLNNEGGAIALVTTTRPVYQSSNIVLNKNFYKTVFLKEGGEYPRLGDVVRITKNSSIIGINNRNFSLLGDPSMRLNYPKEQVKITQINGHDVEDGVDTLRALRKIILTGQMQDGNSNKLINYNGIVAVTVFDKKSIEETVERKGKKYSYEVRKSLIFKGKATVTDGDFNVAFVVPKNISYQYETGKISLYAQNKNDLKDGNGANTDFIIGGTAKNITPDNNAPTIKLYMEDTTFIAGGYVQSNTLLLAKLFDENGINISDNGLGQDIIATLDGEKTFVVNDFYQTNLDSYQKGWVAFPISNLSKGKHTITLKAWDTFNNSGEASIDFEVAGDDEIVFGKVYNIPNPVRGSTIFHIEHNKGGEELTVSIEIFSMKGERVSTLNYSYSNSPAVINNIVWDGSGAGGAQLYDGIYVYKIVLTSKSDGAKNQQYQKLVIIN